MTVHSDLPAGTSGRLGIYDIAGHLVGRTIVVRGTGRDATFTVPLVYATGRVLPAGTYFVRLEAQGLAPKEKKVVLLK